MSTGTELIETAKANTFCRRNFKLSTMPNLSFDSRWNKLFRFEHKKALPCRRDGGRKKVASRMKVEDEEKKKKYQITKAERVSPPDMASTFKG